MRYYLTFPAIFDWTPHPFFGKELTPQHWVEVVAASYLQALEAIEILLGEDWRGLQTEREFNPDDYPAGQFAVLVVRLERVEEDHHEHVGKCYDQPEIDRKFEQQIEGF